MFKIGEFSKICMVSVKALRHWDAEGVLKPASIDADTGYRYYAIDQIAEVNRILAMRAMGLGLPQIKSLLRDHPSADDLRAMLALKRAQLEQEIDEAASMLRMVEARLRQIDTTAAAPPYEVVIKSADPIEITAVRAVVPTMNALVDLLRETHPYALSTLGTNLMAVFHDEAYEIEKIDVEVGFPSATGAQLIPLANKRAMKPVALPAVPMMAVTVHRGPWLSLSEGYTALGRWIDESGYEISGPGREIYHHIDWESEQSSTVTELQFPVHPL